jgi:hypothetical protein
LRAKNLGSDTMRQMLHSHCRGIGAKSERHDPGRDQLIRAPETFI